MYFHLNRRAVAIVVDVPNEDAMFEALYDTWLLVRTYPTISPVVTGDEFGAIMQRIGLGITTPDHSRDQTPGSSGSMSSSLGAARRRSRPTNSS